MIIFVTGIPPFTNNYLRKIVQTCLDSHSYMLLASGYVCYTGFGVIGVAEREREALGQFPFRKRGTRQMAILV